MREGTGHDPLHPLGGRRTGMVGPPSLPRPKSFPRSYSDTLQRGVSLP